MDKLKHHLVVDDCAGSNTIILLRLLEAASAQLQCPVGSESVRMDRVSHRLGGKGRPTPASSSPGTGRSSQTYHSLFMITKHKMPRLLEAVWALLQGPEGNKSVGRQDQSQGKRTGARGVGQQQHADVKDTKQERGKRARRQHFRDLASICTRNVVGQGILLFGAVIHSYFSAAGEEPGPGALRCACVCAAKTGESRGAPIPSKQ